MILKDDKKVDNYNIYFYIYNGSNPPLFYKSVNNTIPLRIISKAKSQCFITHNSELYIECNPPITSKPFNNITQMKDEEAINIYNKENKKNLVTSEYSLEDYKDIIIEWKQNSNINTPNWWESKITS